MQASRRVPPFQLRTVFSAAAGFCCGIFAYGSLRGIYGLPVIISAFLLFTLLYLKKRPAGAAFFLFLLLGWVRSFFPALSLPSSVSAFFSRLADTVGERIDGLFPGDSGVTRAMLLGSKNSAIDSSLKNRLYDLGVGHLLAVSGLHVTILSSVFTCVWRSRFLKVRYAFMSLFLLFFCLLTGGQPSVIRASVMFLYALPAGLSFRRRDSLVSVSLAALIVLALNPGALTSLGFLLSFGSVIGILLLSAPLTRALSGLPRGIASAASVCLAATLAAAPVSASAFSEISVLGLFANLLILPIVPFFLIPAFLVTVLSFPLPGFAAFLSAIPRFFLKIIMLIANLGGSRVLRVGAPSVPAVLLWYAALALFSDYCLLDKKKKYPAAVCCLLAGALVWTFFPA